MKNYETGDVVIKEIVLRNKNTQAEINPSDQIQSIDIYEDFNSPSLYAEVNLIDKIGMIYDFPIVGEEEIDITFQTPGLPYPVTYKFNVYSVSDVQQDMTSKGYSYTLKCVSKEHMVQANINILQSYNETIDDIVFNILVRYLKTNKSIDIDDTKGNETIIINKMTPFTAIDMLRQRAVHKSYVSSSFVFFENQNGFNFKSIEQMLEDGKKNIGTKKFYYFQDTQRNSTTESLMFRSIIEFENIGRTDINDIIQQGGIRNRVKTFDIFTKGVEDTEFDLTQKFTNMVPIDNKNTLNISDTQIQNFANNSTFNFFIPKDTDRNPNYLEDMKGAKRAFLKLFNSNFVRVYIPGDSSIKAGDVVELNLPQSSGTTSGKSTDELVSGNYIVSRLRHCLTTLGKSKHYISMDCNKVGLR